MAHAGSKRASRHGLAVRLRRHRRPVGWVGGLLVALAFGVLAFPAVAPQLVGMAAGWLLWLVGAAMILISGLLGGPRAVWTAGAAGLASIAAGAFLLFNPLTGALAAGLLMAAVLILEGALELAMALDLRPLGAWRWVLSSALASMFAGLAIGAEGLDSRATLAIMLSLAFGSSGAALLVISTGRGRPSGRRRQRAPARDSGNPEGRGSAQPRARQAT